MTKNNLPSNSAFDLQADAALSLYEQTLLRAIEEIDRTPTFIERVTQLTAKPELTDSERRELQRFHDEEEFRYGQL